MANFLKILCCLLLGGVSAGCESSDAEIRAAPAPTGRDAEAAPVAARKQVIQGRAMGTTWRVTLGRQAACDLDLLRSVIAARLESLEDELSHWRRDSHLSQFNRSRRVTPQRVPESLADVIACGLAVHRQSGGALDITAAPLVNLWGFGPTGRRSAAPTAGELTAARVLVDSSQLALTQDDVGGFFLTKRMPEMQLDLSAVAKGYAIDQLAAELDQRGVADYLIELGGELRGRGFARPGKRWRVGIEQPDPGSRGEIRCTIALVDCAIATSGTYRLFRRDADDASAIRSHLLDPRTGRPVEHDLVSVSVIAATAMEADVWATALMVLGPQQGFELAKKRGLAATLVRRISTGKVEQSTRRFEAHYSEPDGILTK